MEQQIGSSLHRHALPDEVEGDRVAGDPIRAIAELRVAAVPASQITGSNLALKRGALALGMAHGGLMEMKQAEGGALVAEMRQGPITQFRQVVPSSQNLQ